MLPNSSNAATAARTIGNRAFQNRHPSHGKDEVIGSIPIKGSNVKPYSPSGCGVFLFLSKCRSEVIYVAKPLPNFSSDCKDDVIVDVIPLRSLFSFIAFSNLSIAEIMFPVPTVT